MFRLLNTHSFLFLVILCTNAFSGVKWSNTTGLLFEDRLESVVEAANGDIIVAGGSNSVAIVQRFTANGKLLWQKKLNNSGILLSSVLELENGQVLVAGSISRSSDSLDWDMVVGVLTTDGNLVKMERHCLPSSQEIVNGILSLGKNQYLLFGSRSGNQKQGSLPLFSIYDEKTGRFELLPWGENRNGSVNKAVRTTDGNIVFNFLDYSKKEIQSILVKVDKNFEKKWEKSDAGVGGNVITSISLSKDDSLLIGGYTMLEDRLTGSYVSRVAPNGISSWVRQFSQQVAHVVNAVTEHEDGHILVSTGRYYMSEPGQFATLLKLTSYGVIEKRYPFLSSEAGETVESIKMSRNNELIFAGASWIVEGLNSNDGYVGVMELN